jgi:regulator of sirC expression with transglutaminase-like and TPR domain
LLAKGQPEKAKVVFEAVLAINEADPVAHKNLGIIYAHYLNDPAKAVEHYKRYLELAPDRDAEIVRQYIRSVEP